MKAIVRQGSVAFFFFKNHNRHIEPIDFFIEYVIRLLCDLLFLCVFFILYFAFDKVYC
jgi:hypothetical protein